MGNIMAGTTLIFVGLFSLISSLKNWDFFMNNHKAQFWIKLFGRKGARIFYSVIGLILIIIGISLITIFAK